MNQTDNTKLNKPIIRHIKNEKILLRKKHLLNVLTENKLEYKRNGICDVYIKYGKYTVQDIIKNLKRENEKEEKRLMILLKKLKQKGYEYDINVSYYRNYIKNGGNIKTVLSKGIKEWFYINKTDYPKLLEIYRDEDIAKSHSLNRYVKENGKDKYTKLIYDTEMTIRLY